MIKLIDFKQNMVNVSSGNVFHVSKRRTFVAQTVTNTIRYGNRYRFYEASLRSRQAELCPRDPRLESQPAAGPTVTTLLPATELSIE